MIVSPPASSGITLRPATLSDVPTLAAWDREPHVIACSNDDPDADVAFGSDWAEEVTNSAYELTYLIAEVDGRPVGAMAVCDPDTGMHHLFRDHLPTQVFAPVPGPVFGAPWTEDHGAELTRLVEAHSDELAAVIVEPVVQGAGGMRFHAPEHLRAVRDGTRNWRCSSTW